MNQNKVGKFIAKKRKGKGLTQSQLAEKINVSDKTISKWENGNSIPDLSYLKSLSEVLEVTISEILEGTEKLKNKKGKNEDNSYNSIKYYINESNKKIKKKYLAILLPIILLFVFVIVGIIFFLNNYNNCYIYTISSKDEKYSVEGVIVSTPEKKIISINSIINASDYDLDSEEIYAYEYRLYYDSYMLYSMGDISEVIIDEYSPLQYLNDALESMKVYVYADYNYLDVDFSKISNDSLILEIWYLDKDEVRKNLKISIQVEKIFSNNKLIYDGGEKF